LSVVGITWADLLAPAVFLASWAGYSLWADRGNGRKGSLMYLIDQLRGVWMRQMLAREVRITDIQVVQVLVQSIAFFASSVVLIIGGGIAVLGAREQAVAVLEQIPFAVATPPALWEAKVLLLLVVFVYAFFKFTWALRQFNYVAILIGAAPPWTEASSPEALIVAEQARVIATRASGHFNKAMRSYYFGLAALTWFIHPYLFIGLTLAILAVVYRREFRSQAAQSIAACVRPMPRE
jgi:uncharacterized membrane protein